MRRDYLEDESEDEEKETREGPGFQAQLPPQRPKPDIKGTPHLSRHLVHAAFMMMLRHVRDIYVALTVFHIHI